MSSNTSKKKSNNLTFQQMLNRTFQNVRKSGDYCGGDRLTDGQDPKVMINGMQEHIQLPLEPSQAKLIIEQCSLAPFGRKDKTILDKSVRHTWQLNPSSFIITNSEWKIYTLNNLKSKIVSDLGLNQDWIKNDLIDLQLYKLLLYEKYSFFKIHRDSEKVDGMFATLVIILPSHYKGGEFVIKHYNQERRFDYSSTKSKCDYYYLVFYADCQHEILPIKDGYRLSLVYNIVVNKQKTDLCTQIPSPPFNEKYVQNISQALIKWSKTINSPTKLIIPFKHQYTKSNISPNFLKGKDYTIDNLIKRSIAELNENSSNQKYLLYCAIMYHQI
ncbi:unnamed protein product [Rotaria sp. Silwood1]|nr:unnamed protein product [Rotaria sp. Silwood1]CAF4843015.1 unnamed protein product [Rotaria sp. Silwood1]